MSQYHGDEQDIDEAAAADPQPATGWAHYQLDDVPALPPVDSTGDYAVVAGDENNGDDDAPPPKLPPKKKRLSASKRDGDVRDVAARAYAQWEDRISELTSYRDKHGDVNVPRTKEHLELGRFVNNQRQNYRKLVEGKKSTLTPERIADLEQLGFVWSMKPESLERAKAVKESNSKKRKAGESLSSEEDDDDEDVSGSGNKASAPRNIAAWNTRLNQLKEFYDQSGHFRVPCTGHRGTKRPRANLRLEEEIAGTDPEIVRLGKWVKRQRRHFNTGTMPASRLDALNEIGFKFKPGRNFTRDERVSVQLGLLDQLRKRRELSNCQVTDLNFLYDEWKRRAEEGIDVSTIGHRSGGMMLNKFDAKWDVKFKELKQFKEKYHHTRVPQNEDKSLRSLAKWVDYQRQSYRKKTNRMSTDKIDKLESIGFEWRVRAKAGVLNHDVESCDAEKKADHRSEYIADVFQKFRGLQKGESPQAYEWNTFYEQLKRYNKLFDTTRVFQTMNEKTGSEYSSQLKALSEWVVSQRTLMHKRKQGKKPCLTKGRVTKLDKINFDWKRNGGKSIGFRGWDMKLEQLKEYKKEHGHCRVPARKKKGENDPDHDPDIQKLAKWVEHQRGMYWKRKRGDKTSLSDERVEALEEIGFEWRLICSLDDARVTRTPTKRKPASNAKKSADSSETLKNDDDDAIEASGTVEESDGGMSEVMSEDLNDTENPQNNTLSVEIYPTVQDGTGDNINQDESPPLETYSTALGEEDIVLPPGNEEDEMHMQVEV